MLYFSCWAIFGWPSSRINLKLTFTKSFLQWGRKIYRTSHILNKHSQLIAPDLSVQNIEFILHIVIATRNSNYGYNAWLINLLIYLFIISSEIFDKPTIFSIYSFIYSFVLSFFHFPSSKWNYFVYLLIHLTKLHWIPYVHSYCFGY